MSKLAIVYWSGTGNTEAMAQAVAEGAQAAGSAVEVLTADAFDAAKVPEYDAIAFGCPAMGAEELEETVFRPMFDKCLPSLAGRKIGLFGSYGWGGGEWMTSWEEECRSAGASLAAASVMANEAPDEEALQLCRDLGKSLAV